MRKLGITDPELSRNHAWRRTFKARAERHGMSERYIDAITGHAPPTKGRSYGKPTPENLAQAMQRFPRYEIKGWVWRLPYCNKSYVSCGISLFSSSASGS